MVGGAWPPPLCCLFQQLLEFLFVFLYFKDNRLNTTTQFLSKRAYPITPHTFVREILTLHVSHLLHRVELYD
jgi:hypothetical protein